MTPGPFVAVTLTGRSGASRSSSPAIPTNVNKAYRRAYVSAAPIRCGVAVSPTGQTGQSDETHSPEEWASDRGSRYLILRSVSRKMIYNLPFQYLILRRLNRISLLFPVPRSKLHLRSYEPHSARAPQPIA